MVLLFVIVTFFIGYRFPQHIIWLLLALTPVAIGVNNLILLNDNITPIRWEQFLFFCSIGIALSPIYKKRIVYVFKNVWPIFIFAIFIFFEVIYGLVDPHETLFKFFMLNNYPSYIAAIILAFCAIQSHKDLVRFQKILSYSAVFIVLIVAIEMIFNFKISHYLCAVNIDKCNVGSLHWASDTLINTGEYSPSERNSSIRRYIGHTGEPNSTAIILAMYTMFLFYYLARVKRGSKEFYFKAISLIFIVINSSVLIIGQTRAAIFLFFHSIFYFDI